MPNLSYLFLLLLLLGCAGNPDSIADTAGLEEPPGSNTPDPNDGNLAIYDVDDDDPYKIANGEFLGLTPGSDLEVHREGLREGKISTRTGDVSVLFIDSAAGEELGYVTADSRDPGAIGNIVITAKNVVTEKGVRVGIEFNELSQRVTGLKVHGSPTESPAYAEAGSLRYELDFHSAKQDIPFAEVPDQARVVSIRLINP